VTDQENLTVQPSHLLLVLFLTFFVLLFGFYAAGESENKAVMVLLECLIALPVLVFVQVRQLSFREIFHLRQTSLSILFYSALIGLGTSVVAHEMEQIVQILIPMDPEILEKVQRMLTIHSLTDGIFLIMGAVMIASVAEEMLFRGFVQGVLEKHSNVTRGVMSTALIFAVFHLNPWGFLEYMLIGVLFGVVVWKTGSIFPAVVAHGVHNLFAVVIVNTPPERLKWYVWGDHVSPVWVAAGLAFIIFGFRSMYQITDKQSRNSAISI